MIFVWHGGDPKEGADEEDEDSGVLKHPPDAHMASDTEVLSPVHAEGGPFWPLTNWQSETMDTKMHNRFRVPVHFATLASISAGEEPPPLDGKNGATAAAGVGVAAAVEMGRQLLKINERLGGNGLTLEELVAIRLYTGPMCVHCTSAVQTEHRTSDPCHDRHAVQRPYPRARPLVSGTT